MQDLGGPPNEIMGELPEGFVSVTVVSNGSMLMIQDLGALGGEEGCTIM
jgi:peroxin-19